MPFWNPSPANSKRMTAEDMSWTFRVSLGVPEGFLSDSDGFPKGSLRRDSYDALTDFPIFLPLTVGPVSFEFWTFGISSVAPYRFQF